MRERENEREREAERERENEREIPEKRRQRKEKSYLYPYLLPCFTHLLSKDNREEQEEVKNKHFSGLSDKACFLNKSLPSTDLFLTG